MSELIFPRLIYRGAPDTLGLGAGETKRCDSQSDLDDDLKAGFRLTREIPEVVEAAAETEPLTAAEKKAAAKAAKDAEAAK